MKHAIVQGSSVEPMLYVVMEGDLHTLSQNNILFKYADDTNLLVPSYSDVSLLSEFEHVKQWAADKKVKKVHVRYMLSPVRLSSVVCRR